MEKDKILEKQNLAYQNILKKVDDVILNAKKSTELLCSIGKAIYGFEKKFTVDQRVQFESFFDMAELIFDTISKAVIHEKKCIPLPYSGNIIPYLFKKLFQIQR